MTGFKKSVAIITLIVFVGTFIFYFPDRTAHASAFSGSCGDNMTWELETLTGELTIKGSGEMTSHPWNGGLNMYPKKVVVQEGVTNICASAFDGCKAIVSVTLPSTIEKIGSSSFKNCVSMTTINLPDGLDSIGELAFSGCSSLENLELPLSLTTIGKSAFKESGIRDIWIPASVVSIGKDAFRNCTALESISAATTNIKYASKDGVLYTKDMKTLVKYPSASVLTTYEIPESVTLVDNDAINNCSELSRLIIPENTEVYIGYDVNVNLGKCSLLTSFGPVGSGSSIEAGWKDEIPARVFASGSSNLVKAVIPEGITAVKESAFASNTKLETVTIPASVSDIEKYAFSSCTALKDVYYGGSEEDWESINIGPGNDYLINANIHFDQVGDTSEVQGDFSSESKKFTGNHGFRYKDSYFAQPSTTYNHSLATMSLCLAFSAYGAGDYTVYDKNVKALMKKCGFSADYEYMSFDFNEKPTRSSIACAVGAKKISDSDTLIAVAVRGGGYEKEWSSNFKLGQSSDHKGFDESADKIVEYIKSYVVRNKIEGDVKIWITGFSRGAAVATQAAAKLNNAGEWAWPKEDGSYATVSFDKEDIYGYGFATPAGAAKSSKPDSEKYNNIFHVIEYNDVVPLVAPADWDFARYGTTYILPYREGNDPLAFSSYIGTLKARMGDEYKVDSLAVVHNGIITLGTYNRQIASLAVDQIGSRKAYYEKYQDILTTAFAEENLDIEDAIIKVAGVVPWSDVLSGGISTTIIDNAANMAETHANQKYYVYWMQLMDSNYSNSMPVLWGSKEYRAVTVNGASEVKVYNGTNDLVSNITDSGESVTTTLVSGIDENGNKVVYLPVNSDYRLDIKAGSAGEVDYRIQEFRTESGNNSRAVSYSLPDVDSGTTMHASVESFTDSELEYGAVNGSSADYTLSNGSKEMNPDYDVTGEEIAERIYDVAVSCSSEQGSVTGGGRYLEGSTVLLTAENKTGYDLKGFYVNDQLLNDGNPDGNKYTVSVKVTGNMEVTAKFVKCTHKWGNYETILKATCNSGGYILKSCTKCGQQGYDYPSRLSHKYKNTTVKADAGKKKNGSITKTCSLCGNKTKTNIYYPKTVKLSYTAYKYNGKQKKPTVKVLNSKGNVISKDNYTVTYQNGRLNVGQYKVTVTFKGNYKGTVVKKFNINPKGANIRNVTKGKKSFTVKWWKQSAKMSKTRITGYQIRYSMNSKFKTYNTKTVKGYSKTSVKISGLKAKTTYYVKVRTYKTVNGGKYYSAWSKSKNIRTR